MNRNKSKPRNLLPKEFQFAHDYCLYLHDCMVQYIAEGEQGGFFLTKFNFKNEQEADDFRNNPNHTIFKWLEDKGYSKELGEILIKSIFPALLSDFCHFIYEALSCSRKCKLTVAYSLLRKPLKENLHYIEWLLADTEGLLNTFYNQPSKYLSFNIIGNPDKIKSIIKTSVQNTYYKYYDPEFIYNLRFNKEAQYGFEGFWNQAIHLITTKEPISTEQMNFNFIFSNSDDHWKQWQHIYSLLPYLLFYTLDICEILMAMMAKNIPKDFSEVTFHRTIGFLLWLTDTRQYRENNDMSLSIIEPMDLNCPKCGCSIKNNEEALFHLYAERKFKCRECNKTSKIPDFIK